MPQKTDKQYKNLLKLHYDFKEIDFIEEDGRIYTTCKDNVMERVRDVYEDKVSTFFEEEKLAQYNRLRDLQPDGEKSCYCGHIFACDCGNPSIHELRANNIKKFKI